MMMRHVARLAMYTVASRVGNNTLLTDDGVYYRRCCAERVNKTGNMTGARIKCSGVAHLGPACTTRPDDTRECAPVGTGTCSRVYCALPFSRHFYHDRERLGAFWRLRTRAAGPSVSVFRFGTIVHISAFGCSWCDQPLRGQVQHAH